MTLDTSDTLAVTAIVVALIALLSTVGQILQQYIGTSEGYRRCQSSVMGLWGQSTRRKFHFGEMRFDVFFQTPEFVVGTAFRGDGRQKFLIDGSTKSFEETRTRPDIKHNVWYREIDSEGEEASWVLLLDVLQHAEKGSREWDLHRSNQALEKFPYRPFINFHVGVRKKTQSWKFVPAGITKPYGFTNISNLIRIVAHLGMHWVTFDQGVGNIVAEGNGLVLTSALIPGLGMLVFFAMTGLSTFQDNMLIPNEEARDLTFGTARSILTEYGPSFVLRFGPIQAVLSTLEILGCTHETISRFERGHQHQFSISFEILGMLGKTFRLRQSMFRRIPNPTQDIWPQEYLFPLVLLDEFQKNLNGIQDEYILLDCVELQKISQASQRILHAADPSITAGASLMSININVLEAVHDAINIATEILSTWTDSTILFMVGQHVTHVLAALHDPLSELNTMRKPRKVVNPSKVGKPRRRMVKLYLETILPEVSKTCKNSAAKIKRAEVDAGVPTCPESDGNVLWCILLFRMICWLTLHDFDPEDVQIVPYSLRHSQVPVYIG